MTAPRRMFATTESPMPEATRSATVLILPGIQGSGPGHWQSLWERQDPRVRRVQQRDWNAPRLEDWLQALEAAAADAGGPVVLAAHSLGCLLGAHWAARTWRTVRGALLVAPPDPDGPAFPAAAASFVPVPERPLPFPSVVVASRDDPYGSMDYARRQAAVWGGELVDLGERGHINAESGLGDWPEGRALLQALCEAG